jgi:hypothetical protein
MGAPTLQSPAGGWPGKILGGLIGQGTSLANTAASNAWKTVPPKQVSPQQDEQQDPAAAKQQGPLGTRDDPHFTKSADGPPSLPMGGVTNAANLTAYMTPGVA